MAGRSEEQKKKVLDERVEMQLEGKGPEECLRMHLDGLMLNRITGISDKYTKLEILTLVHNGLKSFEGLPSLPSLKRLDISENQITEGWDVLVKNCPNLERLFVSGNSKLKDLSSLEPLKKLEKLTHLELIKTPIAEAADYRKKVFAFFPKLKYLDRLDAQEKEDPESEEDEDDYETLDDEDDDEDGEEEDEDEEENGPGLKDLYEGELEDDTEEFEVEDDDDDEEDEVVDEDEEEGNEDEEEGEEEDEEEEADAKRGKKRKLEDEEDSKKA